MNRLSKIVLKLNKFPLLINYILRYSIPFTGTANLKFEKVTNNQVIASLKNKRKVKNHINQIHAVAMILLAESASGIVFGMNVKESSLPLCKSLNSKFVKRSNGAMKATASLTDEQINFIQSTDKGEINVPVIITDESNNEPVICEVVWAWIPKKS